MNPNDIFVLALNSGLKGTVLLSMIAGTFYLSFWHNLGNWSIGSFKYGPFLVLLVALLVVVVLVCFSFRRSIRGDCRPVFGVPTKRMRTGKYGCVDADFLVLLLVPMLLLVLVIYGTSWGLQTHIPVLETNVANITGSNQYRRFNLTDGVVLRNYTQTQSYSCGRSSTCYVTVAPIVPNASTWLPSININLWAFSSGSSTPQSWSQPIRQGLEQSMTSTLTSTVQQACLRFNFSSANFTVMTWEDLNAAYEHAKLVSIVLLSVTAGIVLLNLAVFSPIQKLWWCPVPPLPDDDLQTYQTIQ